MNKGEKMKYKIYKNDTVLNCLKKLLADGRRPATLKETYDLKKSGKIENTWYDTGTIYFEGNIRKATMKELKNIEQFDEKGGRVLFLDNADNGLDGDYNLNDDGRFVGVKK